MLKRIPRMARIGLALILIGGSFYAGVNLWQATRIWVPVDIPILLSRGVTRTDDFKLNLNSSYAIYIVVDEGSNRQETLCLVGMEQCDRKPSILQAHWTLFDHGKPIATGDTDHDKEGFASWKIYKELGVFTANKGKHYSLAIDIQEDASSLNAANPRLFVQDNGQHWIYDSSGGAVLFLVATIFIVLGLIQLARSIFTAAREKRDRKRIAFTFPGPEAKTLYINTENRQLVATAPFTTKTKFHAWIGVCLLILGTASCIGTYTWYITRTFVAVDIPISLARGRIRTGSFLVNLADSYAVNIDTGDSHLVSSSCTSYNNVQANWILYRDGKVSQKWSEETPYTYLGQFNSEKAKYDLELNILSDSSCLDSGHPRLQIYTHKISYVDTVDELLAVSLTTFLTGLSLIILGVLTADRIAYTRQLQLTDAPDFGQYVPYAQSLPLRKEFSGFPAFSIVAWIVLFTAWSALAIMEPITPEGIHVSLLGPGADPVWPDEWTEPIILRVVDVGVGKDPELEINSKRLNWNEMNDELKKEIGRRRPGATVYIKADPNLPWADIAYALDSARGFHAKVVLLTSP